MFPPGFRAAGGRRPGRHHDHHRDHHRDHHGHHRDHHGGRDRRGNRHGRDGRRHGRPAHPATLDDYAQMCEAALALAEATGTRGYLDQAEAWTQVLDRHYWDAEAGGYFLSADDTPALIVRPKTAHDNAAPSGNGTMAGVHARLFYLTGKDAQRERAEATVAAFSGEFQRSFSAL